MNSVAQIRSLGMWLIVGVIATFAWGCSPQTDSVYSPSEKVKTLPARQQEQIAALLGQYYGTPDAPKQKRPDRSEKPGESDTGDEPAIRLVDAVEPARLVKGVEVYRLRCESCHGVSGDGAGPVAQYLDPRPRDYRGGKFKFVSTIRGSKPLRSDLRRTIRRGAKGTSMPSFPFMADEELESVLDYVISLSQRGEMEMGLISHGEIELEETDDFQESTAARLAEKITNSWNGAPAEVVQPVTKEPPYNDESIALGQAAFLDPALACFKCHGPDGTGSRNRNEVLTDDWGHSAFAADLTAGMLRGGRRPTDIYRRVYAGINGTKMPGYGTALEQRPDTVWHLVHFVTAKVEGRHIPAPANPPAPADPAPADPAAVPVEPAPAATPNASQP